MSVTTATGWKLYVSAPSPTTDTLSEYEALTWTEVKEIENLGDFGDESSSVTFASLSDARVRKLKGARDAGTMAIVVGRDPLDAGQQAMIAAEKTNFQYPFKIVAADNPSAGYTPTTFYFQGLVMSARNAAGANDNVVRTTFNVGVNTPIVEDIAAPV
jgi:hypothetical protein